MSRKTKSIVAVAAVAALTSVSIGAAEAGDCKNGHINKGYNVTQNFNQPAKATLFTLSARKKAASKKRRKH